MIMRVLKFLALEIDSNGVTASVVDEETMSMMVDCPDKTYYIFKVYTPYPVEALIDKDSWIEVD